MKPVDQTIIHEPEKGRYGDCFRACIASLLEMPVDKVPHFAEDGPDTSTFMERVQRWLSMFGLAYLEFNYFGPDVWRDIGNVNGYHLICGPSPNYEGISHAVVGKNGTIVHDPSPFKKGLAGTPEQWCIGLLIKTNVNMGMAG